jgi:ABC-type glycerol-3-phosphate transport system permease component
LSVAELSSGFGGGADVSHAARRLSQMRKQRLRTGLTFAAMTLIAVIMLYPFYFMIETSLKSENQFTNGGGFSFSWPRS